MTYQIHVRCLASYNAHILHGDWIDLEGKTESDVHAEIKDILDSSPEEGAEEWAVHDYEGFFPSDLRSEYPSIADLVEYVDLATSAHDQEAFEIFADYEGLDGGLEDFDEKYAGCHDSVEDFAAELWEETMEIPEHVANYIDYEAIARDMQWGGDIWTVEKNGKSYVFWNH